LELSQQTLRGGFMQPRERRRSRPLIAQISSTAEHGRQRRAIPAAPWN